MQGTSVEREHETASALCTAWALRHCVVPYISATEDLSSLALALPSALCSPCFLRIATLHPRIVSAYSPPVGPTAHTHSTNKWPAVPVPSTTSPIAALAATLAGQPTPRPLQELARRCPGLGDALLADPRGLCAALSAVCAAPCGHPESLRLLAALSRIHAAVLAGSAAYAVAVACSQQGSGSGGRAAMLARELSCEPLCAHRGDADAVRVLTAPPYSLTREDLLLQQTGKSALDYACSSGSVELVEALAGPPLHVCREDLLSSGLSALRCACVSGHAGVVARLSQPPFLMGHAEALACNALTTAVGLRVNVAVLDVLAAEPYSVCSRVPGDDELATAQVLHTACLVGSKEVLRRLAQPPYSMGRAEAVESSCLALQNACAAGNVEALDVLAEPPYSIAFDDIRAVGHTLLEFAAASGQVGAVRRLSQAPYSLGCNGNSSAALARACTGGHVAVIEELGRPPYSLGQEEARTADALAATCKEGRADAVRALARQPFCLGHSDASRRANLCLFLACLSGQADIVRALADSPYNLPFDPDNIDSMVSALAPFGALAAADEEIGHMAESALSIAFRQSAADQGYTLSLQCSGGVAACTAWLQHVDWSREVPRSATGALMLLRSMYELWENPVVPERLPGIIAASIRSGSLSGWVGSCARSVLAAMARVSPRLHVLQWRLSVECCLAKLRADSGRQQSAGSASAGDSDALNVVGILSRLYGARSDTLVGAGWGVHSGTLGAIASLPESVVANCRAHGQLVDIVRAVTQAGEFAALVLDSGVLGALAKLIGGCRGPQLCAGTGLRLPLDVVPLAMVCADEAESWETRAIGLEVLCNVVVMVRHVVPHMCDAGDLSSLALSLPSALCSPCFLRIATLHPRIVSACIPPVVPTAPTRAKWPEVPVLSTASPVVALAATLAGQPTPRPLQELARRCPGLGDALLADLLGLCAALCAVCAAPCGLPESLRLLATLSGYQGAVLPGAAAEAVAVACSQQGSGSGARAAALARELSREPLCAHRGRREQLVSALALACSRGHTEAVGVLTAAPYSLGREDLLQRAQAAGRRSALDCACSSGCVDLLEALAGPPLCVCRQDVLGEGCSALRCACGSGNAALVARLSQPPFLMGHAEALACNALEAAAGLRSVAVLDVLAAEPYSVCSRIPGGVELNRSPVLLAACLVGSREVLRRLAQPPFSMGHAEAVCALLWACFAGNPEALDALAEPPYSLTGGDMAMSVQAEEARSAGVLATACMKGRTDVVGALARKPFCLGHSDAASNANLCLFLACLSGQADLVRALSEPPYSLGFDPEDIEKVEAQNMLAMIESKDRESVEE
eukprot:m51a1_g10746 hypothetical protein (1328) ;mRNA; r:342093-348407